MKKLYVCFLLLMPVYASSAQETDTLESEAADPENSIVLVAQEQPSGGSNLLKVNATSFFAKNISLQYERVIDKRMSVALGVRFMPKTGLPFRSTIENIAADDNPEAERLIRDARAGSFAITPEFRYYVGAGYGKGFYLAPFVRYEHFNLESAYTFTAPDNSIQRIDFSGGSNAYGIGLMVGAQFRLGEHVYLDWWILGPYYNHHSLQLDAGGFSISDEEATVLRDELKKIELLNFDMQSTVTNTTASLKAGGSLGAIRGLGLCLSFRF